MASEVPKATLNTTGGSEAVAMPRIGMGTAVQGPTHEVVKSAVLRAIELGYRHFDTAAMYLTEEPVGEAAAEAVRSGLIASRDELFICSKLWCSDAHGDRVVPALRNTLRNLQMEYLDLYLIHWPLTLTPGRLQRPFVQDLMPFDMKSVWEGMEECQRLGLTKAIGVCNFSCKRLETLLSFANIPPAVNQVEVNPVWQQKKLREFCTSHGIQMCAYSPLGAKGAFWGSDTVMDCDVLKEIAQSKGKTVAQICLRWVYEQGDCLLVKSFNVERMKENLEIFDWELSDEERHKIIQIPQKRGNSGSGFIADNGPYKSLEELWDGEV